MSWHESSTVKIRRKRHSLTRRNYCRNKREVVTTNNRIHIFAGHYGSGKTEIAVNLALKLAKNGKRVTVVDLDTVNPYFRTNDAREILEREGIKIIASRFAGTNLDIPTVPPEVTSVFEDKDSMVIFDIGGDEDGAYVLGQYYKFFDREQSVGMHLVVNTKRIFTSAEEDIISTAKMIECASRLKFTDIYNNTNLGKETSESTFMSDIDIINDVSRTLDIPVAMHCGTAKAIRGLKNKNIPLMELDIKIKMPWEN